MGNRNDHILGYDAMELKYTLMLQRNLLCLSMDITTLMMKAAGFSMLVHLPSYTASQLSSVTNVRNSDLTNQDKAAQYKGGPKNFRNCYKNLLKIFVQV
jgi:hypothetical protein